MKKIYLLVTVLLFLSSVDVQAQIPAPPEGQRWVLNAPYSDEFNGAELDQSKWFNKHPYWVGRTPAIFLPEAVSLQGGNMQIKNFKLAQDSLYVSPWNGNTLTYTMAGGAVVSKKANAHYGFYEVKMKASRIRMSSTFWLKNRWLGGFPDAECPNYVTELDIVEAVGGAENNPNFMNNMMSNTHYIHKECGQDEVWHSQGGDAPIGGHVSDDFHVYGAYWKNPNEVDFYIDGDKKHTIEPSTAESAAPFDRPMWINMVTETYNWLTPPTDADLADDTRNTTYYDWIRSYYLLPVEEELVEDKLLVNGDFESGDLTGWTGWGGSPREVVDDANVFEGNYSVHIGGPGAPEQEISLQANTTYNLSCTAKVVSGVITFGIKTNDGNETFLGGVEFSEMDYTQKSFDFTTSDVTDLKLYFFAQAGEEGYADNFELIVAGTGGNQDLVMPFDPSLEYYATPTYQVATNTIFPKIEYKASLDRELYLEMKNAAGTIIGSKTVPALAGYGKREEAIVLNEPVTVGETYTLLTQLHETGNANEIFAEVSTQVTDFLSATGDVFRASNLKVHPNPSHDILMVQHADEDDYVIYGLTGKEISRGKLSQNGVIQIQNLEVGTYFLVIGLERQVFVKM